ncbi:MAG: hypothetical protein S4CHLAM37_12900 [Chlamydiia bacterium]|nr:hypothetical protein [Chlamydiia bacterium]
MASTIAETHRRNFETTSSLLENKTEYLCALRTRIMSCITNVIIEAAEASKLPNGDTRTSIYLRWISWEREFKNELKPADILKEKLMIGQAYSTMMSRYSDYIGMRCMSTDDGMPQERFDPSQSFRDLEKLEEQYEYSLLFAKQDLGRLSQVIIDFKKYTQPQDMSEVTSQYPLALQDS